jgi:hypothetical protein
MLTMLAADWEAQLQPPPMDAAVPVDLGKGGRDPRFISMPSSAARRASAGDWPNRMRSSLTPSSPRPGCAAPSRQPKSASLAAVAGLVLWAAGRPNHCNRPLVGRPRDALCLAIRRRRNAGVLTA